jgi:hypothetical protein
MSLARMIRIEDSISHTPFTKMNVAFLAFYVFMNLPPTSFLFFRRFSSGWMIKSDCMEGRLGASPADGKSS